MHRSLLEDHLAHAEQHVAKAESHVARQKELVAELERRGQDTTEAMAVLTQFEELLEFHNKDRDRLRGYLAECSA